MMDPCEPPVIWDETEVESIDLGGLDRDVKLIP